MRRCRRARGVTDLTAHAISKIFALLLVTLILLHFTAPFKTYDIASPRSDSSLDWLVKDKMGADEKLAGPSDASLLPPALNVIILKPLARPGQIQEPQFQAAILRI